MIHKFENVINQNKLIEAKEIMIATVTCNGLRYFAKLEAFALVQFGAKLKLQEFKLLCRLVTSFV